MNPQWFGDSYDIVKRYFVQILKSAGYKVVIDPMLTGEWNGLEDNFYHFLGVEPLGKSISKKSALLIDPDTGIRNEKSKKHITITEISSCLQHHEIVFIFDQSFSRAENPTNKMITKLTLLKETGNNGFYYDSHARFMFASTSQQNLQEIKQQFILSGLPSSRFLMI